jgi:hypothetical protein
MTTTTKTKAKPKMHGGRLARDEVLHRVNTVLPEPLYLRLLEDAKAARRSLAQQFAFALEQHLGERGKEAA